MAEIIVITSGKGGVGKTTITSNLGAALALEGKKTLLIDTDLGLRNLDIILGLENRIVFNIVDVIKKRCTINQALIRDKRNLNLFLLPASQQENKTAINKSEIIELIRSISKDFDYVLIDCPAGIEIGFNNAIAAATTAIIVTTPEITSIRDADQVISLLEKNNVTKRSLIINKYDENRAYKGEMLSAKDIIKILDINLLNIIPLSSKVITSSNQGKPILYETLRDEIKVSFEETARKVLGYKIDKKEKKKKSFIRKILKYKK